MKTEIATTKLSSKGHITIPEEVINSLGLKTGDQFIIIGRGDSVILKSIIEPTDDEFQKLINKAQKQAKKYGMKKSDISKAIANVRKRNECNNKFIKTLFIK